MRNLTLLFSLFMFGSVVFGQTTSPKVITDDKVAFDEAHFQDFLSVDGDYFYTFGSSDKSFYREKPGRNFYLTKYKLSDFTLVEELEIKAFKYKGVKTSYFMAFSNEAGHHLLTECFHKKLKTKFLLHLMVDKQGKVSEVTEVASMESPKSYTRNFIVALSKDHNKTMIYSDVALRARDEDPNYIPRIWVHNADFSDSWTIEASDGLEDKTMFYPTDIRVSNDGEALVLGYQRKAKVMESNVMVVDQYSLLRHNEQQSGRVYSIKSDEMMIHHMLMDVNSKGIIQLVGMSSEIGGATPDGSFFMQVDPKTMKPQMQVWSDFDTTLLNSFPGAYDNVARDFIEENVFGYYQGHQKRMKYFRVKDIITWEDGSVTAITERAYGRGYVYNPQSPYNITHFDEIVVIDFSPKGEINWTRKIPKYQMVVTRNDGFGSFYTHVGEGELHLIYNDHEDNPENLRNGTEVRDFGGSWGNLKVAMVMATVTREGEMSYDYLYNNFENRTIFFTDQCFQLSNGQNLGLMASPTLSKLQFVKIKFP